MESWGYLITIPLIVGALTFSVMLLFAHRRIPDDEGHSFKLVSDLLIEIMRLVVFPLKKK